MAIRNHLAKLDQLGDQYRNFVGQIRNMAKRFDMDQLTKFLQPSVDGQN